MVDDDADVLFSLKMLLKDHFKKVQLINHPRSVPDCLGADSYDIVLLDMNYSGSDTSGREGIRCLKEIMQSDDPPVVMMTAFGSVDIAIRAMKEGATDFVVKPWQNEKLLATLSSAYQLRLSKGEVQQLRSTQRQLNEDIDKKFGEFIGQSAAMRRLYTVIEKVARTDANILITGENGTGKELVARSVHRQSLRTQKALISVDLGSINEHLFESELFGHVKGAYTDARDDRAGRFEVATGGTLFLDEIGNIPLTLQAKLLTALQNRHVVRMGSNKPIQVDIRLICATNMPVYEKVAAGEFREDLLYRIKTIEINLPPLREREGDVELLAHYFLGVYGRKYRKPVMKLSAETLKKLEHYSWPGNVRELQHAIERAVIMSDARILKPADFFFNEPAKKTNLRDVLKLDDLEAAAVVKALEKHFGNISRAAGELGLSRAALYRKMENMALSNFRTAVLVRILVLATLIGALLYSLFIAGWVVAPALLLLLVAAAIYDLIVFVEKANKTFAGFLLAIKSGDFARHSISAKQGKTFRELNDAMNLIVDAFHRTRAEQETHFLFMQTVVEHMNTAVIAFDREGEVRLMNQAARALLQLPYIKNIYSLRQVSAELCSYITAAPGLHNPILELMVQGERLRLSMRATDFSIQGVEHRLVSVQNIKPELDSTELAAWEQLLHVLTHEIMNSVTPLSSLSATLKEKADLLLDLEQFDRDATEDLSEGLQVIARRSSGLMKFVDNYRSLTTLPVATLRMLPMKGLLEQVVTLKSEQLKDRDISLRMSVSDPLLSVSADAALIEQVLINLVNNASDALAGTRDALIELTAVEVSGKTVISVSDNGAGIEKDDMDKIFVPFYTTRITGSGIGLSLSRQIMRMHNGSISVTSVPGGGTSFMLTFP